MIKIRPAFVIHSPDYTYMHSGVRCLFLLCHHLNRLGYEAHITGRGAPTDLDAPHIDKAGIKAMRRQGRTDIVIYPEITEGNPLGGRRVVRYLLRKHIGEHGRGDYFVHYADEFQIEGISSRNLRIPLMDRTVFNSKGAAAERSGFLIYSVRKLPEFEAIPNWAKPYTVISRAEPRTPQALAELYRRSRALITIERTAAVGEALHCGCPVILIPNPGFDHESIIKGLFMAGLAVGWDQEALRRAERTVRFLPLLYRFRTRGLSGRIHRFVREAQAYFDAREAERPKRETHRERRGRRARTRMTVI
jgi:hypothetical protein